jgi:hypothetical protein
LTFTALLLAGIAINVFKLVVGFEVQANDMETTWTQTMIDTLRASYPNKNGDGLPRAKRAEIGQRDSHALRASAI